MSATAERKHSDGDIAASGQLAEEHGKEDSSTLNVPVHARFQRRIQSMWSPAPLRRAGEFVYNRLVGSSATGGDTDSTTGIDSDNNPKPARSVSPAVYHPLNQSVNYEPTDSELDLLRRTWTDDFDELHEFGQDFFIFLFEAAPGTRQLFPALASKSATDEDNSDSWRQCSAFRTQTIKLVQGIAHVIKHLTRGETRDRHLLQMGKVHASLSAKGFQPNYWVHAKESLEQAATKRITTGKCTTLKDEETEDAQKAWSRLTVFVVEKMHQGYSEGVIEMNGK